MPTGIICWASRTPATIKALAIQRMPALYAFAVSGRDLGMDAAARQEIADERGLPRFRVPDDIGEHAVDDVLLKNAQIAVCERIHLERLQFETQLIGNVAQDQISMIR